jgi:hypothetical protein
MGRFGFVGPSYRSQSVLADCQTCMNWYPESIESGLGRSPLALYPTPGLNLLYQIGAAGMRGMAAPLQGRSFCIQGTSFVELLAPNAAPNFKNWSTTLNFPIPSDGKPVCMAGGGSQMLFVSAGKAYVFSLQTNTLAAVDPSAGAGLPIAFVSYCFGFFFAIVQNVNPTPWQINASAPLDATTWNALDFAEEVEVFSNNPTAMLSAATLLWTFSSNGIQPYSNTGDFPFPFDVIPGTYIENGIAAPFSLAKLDNSLFWLGADERGNGMVWRANGFTPERVSNHAVEYALQSYPTIADAVAFAYQDQGHSFYVLGLPTADKTWVYDVATQMWHERGFWNTLAGVFNRHRAAFHSFNFGMHLVGDYQTGNVYQMSVDIFSDFGNPIRRVRRAPHISKEFNYVTHSRLQVDVEVGIGPNLPGNQTPTVFTLQDPEGNNWTVGLSDEGALTVKPNSSDIPIDFYLNDPASNTSWQITVTPEGQLNPVPVANLGYNGAFRMVSVSGEKIFVLGVRRTAPGIAQLTTTPQGIVGRGPLWTLRWSNDGAQTFSQGLSRDGGRIGEYRRRLLWNRLGRPLLDRVYELSISEAVPARVIEAYLDADGYDPMERFAKQAAKGA